MSGFTTALMVASTAMTALSAIQEGQAASAAADYEASVANRNAEISAQQTKQAMETQDRERRLRRGTAMAGAGASGVGIESFGDILSSSAVQEQMDLLNIKNQGILQQQNFQSEAAFAKYKGKQAKSNSYMKAGSAILGGATKMYGGQSGAAKGGGSLYGKTGSGNAGSTYFGNSNTWVDWN